jgi:mannose-1-phosphate guanylyltransferase/phosphomannomutase
MLPVAGEPVLGHLLALLVHHGVQRVGINLHHKPEVVTSYVGGGERWGIQVTYSYEPELLGTAGAVRRLAHILDSTFYVLYGDVLTDMDLGRLAAFHQSHQAALTLALYRVSNPWECGLVDCDAEGRVRRFVEKPPRHQVFTDLANAGIYVMEPHVIPLIPPGTFYDFGHDLFPQLLARGEPVFALPVTDHEYVRDIGSLDAYTEAQREWARRHPSPSGQEQSP